jgi:outer membrane immunogenic protein
MKKLLLAASCLALTSTISMAADVSAPYTKAPVIAAPVFTWTGFYVGANVGGGMMTGPNSGASMQESLGQSLASISSGFSNISGNGTGAIAGGQFGYNYQQGNWVFGVEGEGFWSGIKLKNTTTSVSPTGAIDEVRGLSITNTGDFTVAGRLGIAFDRTLIYGKGGWAWGDHKFDAFDNCCAPAFTNNSTAHASGTLDGLLVGVGIEHALMRNVTIKFEYDHISFGAKELLITQCSITCAATGTASFSSTKQIFKVGANYLFNVGP